MLAATRFLKAIPHFFLVCALPLSALAADNRTPSPATAAAKPVVCKTIDKRTKPMVRLHTNHGVITLELDGEKAPDTVANFIKYVESGFYDGTVFHRVIDGFMIQGGGFLPGMSRSPPALRSRTKPPTG